MALGQNRVVVILTRDLIVFRVYVIESILDIIFISGFQKRMEGGDACGFDILRTDVYFNTTKTEQEKISISFLGIVATPH